jgi:hypothetical protein
MPVQDRGDAAARLAFATLGVAAAAWVALGVWAEADAALRAADTHVGWATAAVLYWLPVGVVAIWAWRRPRTGRLAGGWALVALGVLLAVASLLTWGDPVEGDRDWETWDAVAAVVRAVPLLLAGALFAVAGRAARRS